MQCSVICLIFYQDGSSGKICFLSRPQGGQIGLHFDAFVPHEVYPMDKLFIADIAPERFDSSVDREMPLKHASLAESLAAKLALKRFLVLVDENVQLQYFTREKLPATVATDVRGIALMSVRVILQLRNVAEHTAADFARIRATYPFVNALAVPFHPLFRLVSLTALLALVRQVIAVSLHVIDQHRRLLERLVTELTAERLLVGMRSLVFLQTRFGSQRPVTDVAFEFLDVAVVALKMDLVLVPGGKSLLAFGTRERFLTRVKSHMYFQIKRIVQFTANFARHLLLLLHPLFLRAARDSLRSGIDPRVDVVRTL